MKFPFQITEKVEKYKLSWDETPRMLENAGHEKYFEYYYPPHKEDAIVNVTLLIADEKGNLKFWDLTRFVDWLGIERYSEVESRYLKQ